MPQVQSYSEYEVNSYADPGALLAEKIHMSRTVTEAEFFEAWTVALGCSAYFGKVFENEGCLKLNPGHLVQSRMRHPLRHRVSLDWHQPFPCNLSGDTQRTLFLVWPIVWFLLISQPHSALFHMTTGLPAKIPLLTHTVTSETLATSWLDLYHPFSMHRAAPWWETVING